MKTIEQNNNVIINVADDIMTGTVNDNATEVLFLKRIGVTGLWGVTVQELALRLIECILKTDDIWWKKEIMYYDPLECWTVARVIDELIKLDSSIIKITN